MWWHTAKNRFRLSAKRTSPFKSAGASVRSTAGSRGVRIGGSNAGYTMFRVGVKGTGYALHSPFSPSLPLPCVTCAITFQLESTRCSSVFAPPSGSLNFVHAKILRISNYWHTIKAVGRRCMMKCINVNKTWKSFGSCMYSLQVAVW